MINKLKSAISYLHPVVIKQCRGQVSSYLEISLENGRRTLNTSKVNYSYGSLHSLFDQTFKRFGLKKEDVKNVLILGFGGGSVASILKEKYNPDCSITGIEKDQAVIELTQSYFNLERFEDLEILCLDANEFVQSSKNLYDLIVVDLFVEDQVPKGFHRKEFLDRLNQLLQPHGTVFFNKIVGNSVQEGEMDELFENMKIIFGEVYMYRTTLNGIENYMLIHDGRPMN